MKKVTTLREAFISKIEVLYDIENELVKALPKLAENSLDPELRGGFESHLKETNGQIERLEQIFSILNVEPEELKSKGIIGIIEDNEWVIKQETDPILKDGMIAAAARYAEHYEMAGYMSAIAEAKALGLSEAQNLLEETLKEEQNADKKLEQALEKSMSNE